MPQSKLIILTVDDQIINPIIADYLIRGIDRAETEKATAVIVQLDTPGGLLSSTHQIVRRILNAKVPVIVYIWPKGARGGSAGVFITLASHVAAMAPSTHIGAAHPVEMGEPSWFRRRTIEPEEEFKKKGVSHAERGTQKGKEEEKTEQVNILAEKITNDTVAWVRSMAKNRGRSEELAVKTVLESASLTEEEAKSKKLVEIIANDLEDLLRQLEGREISLEKDQKITLTLGNSERFFADLSMREKILSTITNPNIAYILMILGFLGLLFEFTHPGIAFPGIGGAICLILAFVAFQTLPIDYGGLLLVGLALALFITEAFVPSYGLLTIGGISSMILGSMMLVKSPLPLLKVSWTVFMPVVVATALVTLFLASAAVRAHRQKIRGGKEQLVDSTGVAETALNPAGKVFIDGEIWEATSDQPVAKGERVRVVRVEGLRLHVRKEEM